jgi:hypothetical protein
MKTNRSERPKQEAKSEPLLDLRLISNALDFIASSGDYANTTADDSRLRARALKYSVLHLAAGVELLLKERLRLEHWALIYELPDQASEESWKSGDFRSVGGFNLIKRLEGVTSVRFEDDTKQLLKSLREHRNRLEHFEYRASEEAVRSLIYAVSSFALDFVHGHLKDELTDDDEALMDEVKQVMFDNEQFVTARMLQLGTQLDAVRSQYSAVITCPGCRREAFHFNDEYPNCLFCHLELDPVEAAERWDDIAVTVDPKERWGIYQRCPECDQDESFVNIALYEGNESGRTPDWLCFSCGFNADSREVDECMRCGEPFLSKNGEADTICPQCFDYVMKKDD